MASARSCTSLRWSVLAIALPFLVVFGVLFSIFCGYQIFTGKGILMGIDFSFKILGYFVDSAGLYVMVNKLRMRQDIAVVTNQSDGAAQ